MKNICLSVAFCLSVVPQFAMASGSSSRPSSGPSKTPAEICVRKFSELNRTPEVASAVEGFGGLATLEGDWKMSGFISMFAKAQVGLSHTRQGAFSVEINKSYSKPFYMCVTKSRPDLITMYVQQAENPSFAKLVLKPGRNGETLYVAVEKTKWKFIKFKRPSND